MPPGPHYLQDQHGMPVLGQTRRGAGRFPPFVYGSLPLPSSDCSLYSHTRAIQRAIRTIAHHQMPSLPAHSHCGRIRDVPCPA